MLRFILLLVATLFPIFLTHQCSKSCLFFHGKVLTARTAQAAPVLGGKTIWGLPSALEAEDSHMSLFRSLSAAKRTEVEIGTRMPV